MMPANLEIWRRVMVMMPFGGGVASAEKMRVLTFLRIKYIVEDLISVSILVPKRHSPDDLQKSDNVPEDETPERVRVRYRVDLQHRNTGSLLDDLTSVVKTDTLIVVLDGFKPNVLFELAVRNALRSGVVLIVFDRDSLPDYCSGDLYIDWRSATDSEVNKRLEEYANRPGRLDFSTPIDPNLRQMFARDETLSGSLERALEAWEQGQRRASHLERLMKYVSPGEVICHWDTFFPLSIVRITWTTRSGPGYYTEHDLLRGPVVQWANPGFLEMFGLEELPEPLTLQALTASRMVDRLRNLRIVNEEDLGEFLGEQKSLMYQVFYEGSRAPATVPLRFNDRAPELLREKWYLPTVVGKNVIGPTDSAHDTYVAIMYTPVENTRRERKVKND
jgi:hypothetical protein